ncbi:HAD-like protein [Aspergillus steynii IBT 23096]|uniref:HAD-like protein n=1 Tax=Aspergillus steynii IBT 23096 TaxID=1392250 RepID=A0A2I2G3Z6_9EURO|nr:HAD-like protein [Aspergillus steynii IBT 23096]PLB47606.1 HAD-like protein [Aspergillus steynii IBT 23096]
MPKHIVFDVVGTLITYPSLISTLTNRLGPQLLAQNITPSHLIATWFEVAEREYAYLSISNAYLPFDTCFENLFYRTLFIAGIRDPKAFASREDLDAVLQAYKSLTAREGAAECVRLLTEAGFTVWGLTAGSKVRVSGYLDAGEVGIPEGRLLSCDEGGVGKPDLRAYRPLWERLTTDERGEDEGVWFAAAHAWDVSAARRVGFKAAYCTALEGEPIPELFGEMDVVGESLVEMAKGIITAQGGR